MHSDWSQLDLRTGTYQGYAGVATTMLTLVCHLACALPHQYSIAWHLQFTGFYKTITTSIIFLHYLDDFLTAGPAGSLECQHNLDSMIQVCNCINAPIKPEKVVNPTTQITFLGIQIDTMTMTASITKERKLSILDELQSFRTSKTRKRTKRQVLSLIGKLSFVSKVVPAGRIFLRRLIDLSMSVKHLHYRIPITLEAQRDLAWWQDFLPSWSGTSLILDTHWTPSSSMQLFYRCFWNRRMGCLLEWPLVTGTLVTSTICHAYRMERTLCHSLCC